MTSTSGLTLSTRTVYTGRIFTVAVDRVRMPHGRVNDMEIIRHPISVVLVPMPDPTHVILVRQYRSAIARWIWELPAGSVETGETEEAAARRECHEETGRVPRLVERLGAFYPTPGYCDEIMTFFRLGDLERPSQEATPDADEVLEPQVFAVDDARRLIHTSDIVDMKTVVGLQLI